VTGFDYSDSLRDAVRRSSLIDRPLRASNRLVGGGEIRRIRAEPIPVLGSQRAGDVSHKPGGRLPLLSAGPAVTPAKPLRGLLPVLLLGEQRHNGCEQFA